MVNIIFILIKPAYPLYWKDPHLVFMWLVLQEKRTTNPLKNPTPRCTCFIKGDKFDSGGFWEDFVRIYCPPVVKLIPDVLVSNEKLSLSLLHPFPRCLAVLSPSLCSCSSDHAVHTGHQQWMCCHGNLTAARPFPESEKLLLTLTGASKRQHVFFFFSIFSVLSNSCEKKGIAMKLISDHIVINIRRPGMSSAFFSCADYIHYITYITFWHFCPGNK